MRSRRLRESVVLLVGGVIFVTACPRQPKGAFQLSVSGRTDLLRGFGGPLVVTVSRQAGFADPVTLSVQNPPEGLAASDITVENATGVLQIQVDSTAREGPYALTVLGSSTNSAPQQVTIAAPVRVRGAPGAGDETFGDHGLVTLSPGNVGGVARAVAAQLDGRLLVAGFTNDNPAQMALARFWPDGGLDRQVIVDFCGTADVGAFALAQTSDGILLAGDTKCDGPIEMAFAKLRTADLSLDPSFGPNQSGHVSIAMGINDSAYALAVQPDGKIVAGGASLSDAWDLALVRLESDGQLDSTFGDAGVVKTRVASGASGQIRGLALRGDGSLVAVGIGGDLQTSVLAAYDPGGALIPGFGDGGMLVGPLGAVSGAWAITRQDDGQLVIGGTVNDGSNVFQWVLGRYSASGVPDQSFGTAGLVTTDFGSADQEVFALITTDAGLYAGGYALSTTTGYDFAVARYHGDGTLDQTFGIAGTKTQDFDGGDDLLFGLTLDSADTVVGAGLATVPDGTTFGIWRLWQ